jgi:PBP1b-binding outer membrane lipoprotein LpoB
LRDVEIVSSKENCKYELSGIGKVEVRQQAAIQGTAIDDIGANIGGGAGEVPNAILSIKLIDHQTGEIVFVTNKSQIGGKKGSTHEAVISAVKDMKKKMEWK